MIILPNLPPDAWVAVDTETSGLYCDPTPPDQPHPARLSIVSIAWWLHDEPGPSARPARVEDWSAEGVGSASFAFDQGAFTPLGAKPGIPRKVKNGGTSLFDLLDSDDPHTAAAPNLSPAAFGLLMDWLAERTLIMHNAKFDLLMLAAGLRGLPATGRDLSACLAWDSQVCNLVLWPEYTSSLKPTAERLWGESERAEQRALQEWLKKNGYRFDLAPWGLVAPYAAKDAELTLRLAALQQEAIELGEHGAPHEVRTLCEVEVDLAVTLFRMERRGVGIDANAMDAEAHSIARLADRAKIEINTAMGRAPAQPVTEHVMRRFWFDPPNQGGLGIFPVKMTDGGIPSVAADVVRDLEARGVRAAPEYARLNKLETSLSMWYGVWPRLAGPAIREGGHPRLRTTYRQGRSPSERNGGTVSGRLAVERVQLQAIPHDYQIPEGVTPVRAFLCADPGFELWELDLSQAEMRVAAGVSNCKPLIEAFERGEDAHDTTTRLMFRVEPDDPRWKKLRNVAKRLNFGMIYGAGVGTIRQQILIFTGEVVEEDMVRQWLAAYRKTFPELNRASRRAMNQAERTREVTLINGRRRWFAPWEPVHKAFNAKIQGGVGEIMKQVMIDVEANHPGVLLLQIHDSLVLEVPEGDQATVGACQDLLCKHFSTAFGLPFTSDAKRWDAA